MFWFDMGSYNDSRNREAVTHSFCHCIDIGIYSGKIMAAEFTASSETALYAISNINSAMLVTKAADGFKESFFCYINTAYTLYAFYNNGRYFLALFGKAFFQRFFIIKWKEYYIVCFIYRGYIILIIGNRYRKG